MVYWITAETWTTSARSENIERLGNIFDGPPISGTAKLWSASSIRDERHSHAHSQRFGLKTVVTNDCRYLQPQDAVTLDILICIARGEEH